MQNIYKEFFEAYRDFNLKNLSLINDFYKNTLNGSSFSFFNEDHIKSINEANKILFSDPEFIKAKNDELLNNMKMIFERFYQKMHDKYSEYLNKDSKEKETEITSYTSFIHPKDKRFSDSEWSNNPFSDLAKEFYGAFSNWLTNLYSSKKDEIKDYQTVEFIVKQYIDAISPSNNPMINPTVVKNLIESNGESFINGMKNLLEDFKDGKTLLNPTTNDQKYFEIGKNIATTKGKVVYQNDMMQLIQYDSTTKKNYAVPILIISPWINKYYIMDLSPDSSFVKWLVDQGFTVFIVSWVNPDSQYRNKSFENYANEGIIAALNKIYELLNVTETNVIGYCLGGTLLASTLAILNSKECKIKLPNKIKTGTFIATLTDFTNVGDFSIFTTEKFISNIEKLMEKTGYLDKSIMFKTFNLLKANDMIWSNVVRNYLMGQEPIKMDILSWNADTTNMPYAMHSFLLRNMYQKNLLKEPGKLKLLGLPVDLRKVNIPTFMLATEKDHIAPWKSTFSATKLFSGPMKFVLGGSGHVAGVINSVKQNKYYYYVNDQIKKSADEWLKNAQKFNGSWWNEWQKWITQFAGEMIQSRTIKKWIEEAPGSYVKNFVPQIKK